MARKKNAEKLKPKSFAYDYIRASVNEEDMARFTWKLKGLHFPGSIIHDEPITGWTDSEIADLAKSYAGWTKNDAPINVDICRQ